MDGTYGVVKGVCMLMVRVAVGGRRSSVVVGSVVGGGTQGQTKSLMSTMPSDERDQKLNGTDVNMHIRCRVEEG